MTMIKLFHKPNCARCPLAIALCNELQQIQDIIVESFDVTTDIGLAEASFYQVQATPAILVVDEEECECIGWRGDVPTLEHLTEVLDQ